MLCQKDAVMLKQLSVPKCTCTCVHRNHTNSHDQNTMYYNGSAIIHKVSSYLKTGSDETSKPLTFLTSSAINNDRMARLKPLPLQ